MEQKEPSRFENNPHGLLALIWNKIRCDRGITVQTFMRRALNFKVYGGERTPVQLTRDRQNFVRAVFKTAMSFKIFIQGLRAMGVAEIDIIVVARTKVGQETVTSTTVVLEQMLEDSNSEGNENESNESNE